MKYLIIQIFLIVLAVGAAVAVAAWGFKLLRLRQHRKILRDAEELKSVDLSSVITAHIPTGQRTQDPHQEMAVVKDIIAGKQTRDVRALLVSSCALVLTIGGAVAVEFLETGPAPGTRGSSVGIVPPTIDALASVPGKWGWKFNALMSCTGNPHTISVSEDRRRLSLRFEKPLTIRGVSVPGYDYDIVGSRPSELILRPVGAEPEQDDAGRPVEWIMHFDNQGTYVMKRSVPGIPPSGEIGRCT